MKKHYTRTDIKEKLGTSSSQVHSFIRKIREKSPYLGKRINYGNKEYLIFSREEYVSICKKLHTFLRFKKKNLSDLLIIEFYLKNLELSNREICKTLNITEEILKDSIKRWKENDKCIIVSSKMNKERSV